MQNTFTETYFIYTYSRQNISLLDKSNEQFSLVKKWHIHDTGYKGDLSGNTEATLGI